MIINVEREPNLSLYYLGGILLSILKYKKAVSIEDLILETHSCLDEKVYVDFIYYALDWLFLLSLITIEEGTVYYENRKINSTQNETF